MIVEMIAGAVLHHAATDRASRSELRAPLHDWSSVAQCESGGDWHADTGNGYYGGLQFSQQTWLANGGAEFADRPDLATEGEQIIVAERLCAIAGAAPWPQCGQYLQAAS